MIKFCVFCLLMGEQYTNSGNKDESNQQLLETNAASLTNILKRLSEYMNRKIKYTEQAKRNPHSRLPKTCDRYAMSYWFQLIKLMEGTRLTSTDLQESRDDLGEVQDSEWVIVQQMRTKKDRRAEGLKWVGRIGLPLALLLLLLLAYGLLPPLAAEPASPAPHGQQEKGGQDANWQAEEGQAKGGQAEGGQTEKGEAEKGEASTESESAAKTDAQGSAENPTEAPRLESKANGAELPTKAASAAPSSEQGTSAEAKGLSDQGAKQQTPSSEGAAKEPSSEAEKQEKQSKISPASTAKQEEQSQKSSANSEGKDSQTSFTKTEEKKESQVSSGQKEEWAFALGEREGEGAGALPRVLWVQIGHALAAKTMEEAMAAQNHIYFGNRDGFEVRVVDDVSAYDWLSAATEVLVKKARARSRVEAPVSDLLRLALLYEHGGVFVRPGVLLMEGLGWVERLMEGASAEEQKVLLCGRRAEVVVYHQGSVEERLFKDDFIAARPRARLVRVLLEMAARILAEGVWPYTPKPNLKIAAVNADTKITTFSRMTEGLLNAVHENHADLCEEYGVQSFDADVGVFMALIGDREASSTMRLAERAFTEKRGRKYLLKVSMHSIAVDIVAAIKTGDLSAGGGESLLKTKLFMAEGNRRLTTPSPKTRDVRLCVVSLTPARAAEAEQSVRTQLARLSKQSFAKWNLVAFVEAFPYVSKPFRDRAVLVNASQYEGLNLQRAATKYCDPASVMLLLDLDETLATDSDLETLANHFKPIGVYAAFFNLKIGERSISPSAAKGKVQRILNKPNQALLFEIGNLMRAFTVQSYRFISHIDLRHSLTGRYFDREIPLLSMLEVGENFSPCDSGNIVFQVRRFEELMAVPRQKVSSTISINTTRLKTAQLTRHEYFAKFRYYRLCETMYVYQYLNEPVEQMVVFNDGREEEALSLRKGLPELIPRKIHQVWVGGEIPAFKQFLMKRMRDIHPTYEYFLWTEQNITQENFPESYDLLQTLVEFDKKSPYSKMAAIADIMRNEIVYRHGGFYFDTNYMLFGESPLDQFLSYSLMDVGGMPLRQRVFRDNAVFGAMKNHPSLARIVSHRAVSSRNQYSWHIVQETGPGLFGRIQRGKEELDPTIFQQTLEEFYPNYLVDQPSKNINKCETPNTTPDSEVLFRSPKHSYLKNCSSYYSSYAFGMDFGSEGGSYLKRRW